jgi:hypothetical protein
VVYLNQNKMKQTAVEWLVEQLTEVDYGCINKTFLQNNNSLAGHKLRELLEQAKEMEKEQIQDAHIEGQRVFDKYPHTQWTNDQAESYYNETFKSE